MYVNGRSINWCDQRRFRGTSTVFIATVDQGIDRGIWSNTWPKAPWLSWKGARGLTRFKMCGNSSPERRAGGPAKMEEPGARCPHPQSSVIKEGNVISACRGLLRARWRSLMACPARKHLALTTEFRRPTVGFGFERTSAEVWARASFPAPAVRRNKQKNCTGFRRCSFSREGIRS